MNIAVQGCCHGELNNIYRELTALERRDGVKADLLIITGDFQAVRDKNDLQSLAVPPKYRQMGDFWDYFQGKKTAPILTVFIGGNHEASNYMSELYYGGWVCPNIYYLGAAGVVNFNGLRIAGLSGIYKAYDYKKGHFESPPYSYQTMRSVYHVRQFEVEKLLKLSPHPEIFLSHDWPQNVYRHGNEEKLLGQKPFFRDEVRMGTLGSPAAEQLMSKLKPDYWFSSHLHVRFEAEVEHEAGGDYKNPDEIPLDLSVEADGTFPNNNHDDVAVPASPRVTHFLALDKCLPRRKFLEIVRIGREEGMKGEGKSKKLLYDPEWLAITRAYVPFFSQEAKAKNLPSNGEAKTLINKERVWVDENITQKGLLDVIEFQHSNSNVSMNPQTEQFYKLLQLG